MKQALPLLVPFFFYPASAQNLVPNPGFEDIVRMPSRNGNQVQCTRHWRSPTGAGTDYYHFEADHHAGTPGNVFGHQQPHEGEAYAGFCLKGKYMEHLGVTLRDTLTKGQSYLVEFFVSRADRSPGSAGELGILFLDRKQFSFTEDGITEKPSLDFTNSDEFNSKGKWTKLSGVYEAEGNEVTLILGYFNYDESKKCKTFCHYYIDDVSVTPLNDKTGELQAAEALPEIIEQTAPKSFSPEPGEAITLRNVFFDTNKSELLPASYKELDKLVTYLSNQENTLIEISGHTDNTGMESQNVRLSELRAEAIADYLISHGIDASRITSKGYGSSRPAADNDTEAGRTQNRRVEFTVTIE